MSAGYWCPECKWLGEEPEMHRTRGDKDAGESYWVVQESCPDCGYSEIVETAICEECGLREADDGYDECHECRVEEDQCQAERAYDIRMGK